MRGTTYVPSSSWQPMRPTVCSSRKRSISSRVSSIISALVLAPRRRLWPGDCPHRLNRAIRAGCLGQVELAEGGPVVGGPSPEQAALAATSKPTAELVRGRRDYFTARRGTYVQSGSSANTSPVVDHARAREPPQISCISQTPHRPPNVVGRRICVNIGAVR